ncbi:DedA family protein [Glycomyces tarimensis]
MSISLPIVALLLVALVIADFFVPMVPSATTIATIAGFLVGDTLLIASLIAWAAFASWLGDVLGYRALRYTRGRMKRPIFGSARITLLEIRLRGTLRRHPRWTTVVARFLPAGRTALAWAAVATPGYAHSRMALIAGAAWASYMVGVGLLIGWIFGAGLLSAATTITSIAALTIVLGWFFRRAPIEPVEPVEP